MKQLQKLDSLPTYNSGVVNICEAVAGDTTSFGAKTNINSLDDLTEIAKLNYSELSNRVQDFEFAEQHGFSLSLKIKTRYKSGIDNKLKALINNYLYDIQYIDKTPKELYFYLEGVKQL
jgi:SPP1 family predicted phage head-tail adaptor